LTSTSRQRTFDRYAELRAHRAAPAVTGQKIRAFDFACAVRGVEARDHAAIRLPKRRQTMLQMERPGAALIDRHAQDRLEVMLRHVDHEGITRVVAEKGGLHGRPRRVGRALDVADLVDAQRFGENPIGDAVTSKNASSVRVSIVPAFVSSESSASSSNNANGRP
jgi:hypothetical protein